MVGLHEDEELAIYAVPFKDTQGRSMLNEERFPSGAYYVIARNPHEALGLATACLNQDFLFDGFKTLLSIQMVRLSNHGHYNLTRAENLEEVTKKLMSKENWR